MTAPLSFDPESVMQADLAWLKRRRAQILRFSGQADKKQGLIKGYETRLSQSQAQRQARAEQAFSLPPAPELPISAHEDDLIQAIKDHQVLIVAGETGSGKSTRLPLLCLAAGRGQRGLIGCTQPRRIAARSVARRVGEELGETLGQSVGFQVRFNEKLSRETRIKFMTDGIALAEIHGDRWMDRYDTLIIDEAHERSLNIDFLLGYLKQLLKKRPDLKLIVTSATIDTERFSAHFDQAPVVTVEGRGYPVEVQYQAANEGEDLAGQVSRAVKTASRLDPRGDILVFLPGEREIFQVARHLRRVDLKHTEVLPLYARLPTASQDRIFSPGSARRIVLATNVAETSLTVPGIRFVIDSGLARISRYAAHSRVLRLPVEPVSQAACQQRAGRCGRIGPGVCIRLFEEDDFLARPEFTEPEIQRSGLVGVVLEMLALGLGEPEAFPFIDPPPRRLLGEARQSLFELGATDDNQALTPLGKQLARLPVDARHGRILVEAHSRGALAEALVLVSALSIADVRERPLDQQQAADQAHQAFVDPDSDFSSLLKLWQWWQQARKENSRSQADKLARKQFLSPQRLYEWGQLHSQLGQIARDEGWRTGPIGQADTEAVHRSLLAGLLSMIGQHQEKGEYQGARGHKFRIFPGSALARRQPGWVMAGELVETGRTYARLVAPVKPAWLEQQADHLLKRRVYDPHWDRRSGRVMGYEQISLHGLVLAEKRRIHYGPHDPETARFLLIRHGLVRGEINHRAEFLKRNQALREELAEHEHKRRRRDVLATEEALEAFFDERLPGNIFTAKAFGSWYDRLKPDQREQLLYDRATLLREDAPLAGQTAFPERLRIGQEDFVLDYHFDPADERDGVTLHCPLHLLNRLDPGQLDWLVPGMLEDKVTALIASLPKSKRRALVPAAEFGRAATEALEKPEGALRERLARELSRMSGLDIGPDDFQLDRLPEHFKLRVLVRDEAGKVIGAGRDIQQLKDRFAGRARQEFMRRQTSQWQRDGLRIDQIDELPDTITTRGGHQAWPALVEQGHLVGIRLFDDPDVARQAHHGGIFALLKDALADKWKYLKRSPELSRQAQLAWTRVEDIGELCEALRELALRDVLGDAWPVRGPAQFDALTDRCRRDYLPRYQALAKALEHTVLAWHELSRQVESLRQAVPKAIADVDSQLDDLLYAGFLADIQAENLLNYPRYLKAVKLRLNALELDPVKDAARQAEVAPWWENYLGYLATSGEYGPALDRYRWLIEEYRVQLFAQHLGTQGKVSAKRLGELWAAVEDTLSSKRNFCSR